MIDSDMSETLEMSRLYQRIRAVQYSKLVNAIKIIDSAVEGPAYLLKMMKTQLNDSPSAEKFIDLILSAWTVLSDIEASSVFHFRLNIYFRTRQIDMILASILLPIHRIISTGSKGTGSCPLISGPRGVGKTTMLSCIFVILFLLLDEKVVPIFIDYSVNEILLSVAIVGCTGITVVDEKDIIDVLSKAKRYTKKSVVLFVDELQKLYTEAADNEVYTPRRIVSQIAELGKNRQHYCVCSGSSTFTATWAYSPELYFDKGYVTLNSSVYRDTPLNAITDQEEFTALCMKLCTHSEVDPAVTALYIYSGGVGRFFDGQVKYPEDILQSFNKTLRIPDIVGISSAADAWLSAVFSSMLAKIYRHLHDGTYDPWKHRTEHSYGELETLGKVYGIEGDNYRKLLRQCCDRSILKREGTKVDILRPAIIVSLYAQQGTDDKFHSRMESYAMLGVLTGWCDSGQEEPYPTPGHRNERPMIDTAKVLLQFSHPIVELDTLTNEESDLTVDDFLNACVIGCANLYGVEGLCLTASSEEANCFDMAVFQVKTGRLDLPVPPAEFNSFVTKARAGGVSLVKRFKSAKVRLVKIVLLFTPLSEQTRREVRTMTDVTVFERDDVLPFLQIDNATADLIREWRQKCRY